LNQTRKTGQINPKNRIKTASVSQDAMDNEVCLRSFA
jgi:hypothetical protein